MKKKIAQKFISLFAAAVLISSMAGLTANAANEPTIAESKSSGEVQAFISLVETRYRVNNGILQYRRWSTVGQYWVDPCWFNL